jgi:D-alanine-D-alanine ligase
MGERVAIVYNEPHPSRYDVMGEERAVLSVVTAAEAVCDALLRLGYRVSLVPINPPMSRAAQLISSLEADVVFNLFEGFSGQPETEALLPELAAQRSLRCTGCPAAALRLALDKTRTKDVLRAAGIATPDFQILTPATIGDFRLGFPGIVKPGQEDASHGISASSVVHDFAVLAQQVEQVSERYGGSALVEEFIDGPEFNVTILGNSRYRVLPVSEIVYTLPEGMPRLLTFTAKWEPASAYFQGTKAVCPAQVSTDIKERIIDTARRVFKVVCGGGYGRVDMRQAADGCLQVIDVNPNPDISPDSGAALQAKAGGMSYPRFIAQIIGLTQGEA